MQEHQNLKCLLCFLAMQDDSIDGYMIRWNKRQKSLNHGVGLSIHNVNRFLHRGTNGTSNGIVPMLRVFNDTARYVDQGGGKGDLYRNLHVIFWFLDLKKYRKRRNAFILFLCDVDSDLFMKRVQEDGNGLNVSQRMSLVVWCMVRNLRNVHWLWKVAKGRKHKAHELWEKILESQIETGTPYMLYKDAANRKSNQKNLGTIRSSNLCTGNGVHFSRWGSCL
jgi:ribonucleoside-diphosphate reductase alpha chain